MHNSQFANVFVRWWTVGATGAARLVLPHLAVVLGRNSDTLNWVTIADINVEHACVSAALFQLHVEIVDNGTFF